MVFGESHTELFLTHFWSTLTTKTISGVSLARRCPSATARLATERKLCAFEIYGVADNGTAEKFVNSSFNRLNLFGLRGSYMYYSYGCRQLHISFLLWMFLNWSEKMNSFCNIVFYIILCVWNRNVKQYVLWMFYSCYVMWNSMLLYLFIMYRSIWWLIKKVLFCSPICTIVCILFHSIWV